MKEKFPNNVSVKTNGARKKLSVQISIMIGITSLVVMAVLSTFSVATVRSIISKRLMSEFTEIADNNGNVIQNMLEAAEKSNQYIVNYHDHKYISFMNSPYSSAPQSDFYDVKLNNAELDAESYYTEVMKSSMKNNKSFGGMGVYFEPFAFNSKVEQYSIYVYRDTETEPGKNMFGYTLGEDYMNDDWYQQVVTTGKSVITEPYVEEGETLVSIANPLMHNDKVVGVSLVDIYTSEFSNVKSSSEEYKTMSAGVINDSGNYLYNSQSDDMVGKSMNVGFKNPKQYDEMTQKMQMGENFYIDISTDKGIYRTYYNPVQIEGRTWWSYTGVFKNDMMKAANTFVAIMAVGAVVSIAALVSLATIMIVKKLKPLKQLNDAADSLLKGNFGFDISYVSEDEIGQACGSMKAAFQGLRTYIGELSRCMKALENCDLTVAPQIEFKGDFAAIETAYTSLITNLNNSFQEIKVSADQINIGAEQISGAAQTLSQGSTEQAASVEQLSAMINDVTDTIKKNANGAYEANNLSVQVGNDIKQSSQYMNDLMSAMDKITVSSNEVNKIIKTIDDIAFQTNILALNAAVEAARAGSAGKGFAVVADEVRNLAGKSAEAAKSTTALIESEIKAVADGTEIANQTAQSLEQVVSNVEAITVKVQEINESSEKQSVAVDQINTGATQISAVIQANSATSEESAAASEELAGQAGMLDSLVKQFKLQSDET